MNQLKVSARKLLLVPIKEVWEHLRGEFTLVMDDGEIQTNHKEVAYSRIFWELIAQYPETPLLLKHHYQNANKDRIVSSKTHLKMFDAVFWDVVNTYASRGLTADALTQSLYGVNNYMYNELSTCLASHQASMDIVDICEILNDPEVMESQKGLIHEPRDTNRSRNQGIIDDVTEVLKKVFKENKYPNNPVSKITRAKLVRAEQVYQGLGVRGYLTDTGSDIFAYPIMTGFVRGMNKFHDVLIESRSASKSLYFSKTPLQDAEYFSRKLQVLCQTLKNIHPGDCGSQNYMNWRVRPTTYADDGTVDFKGDLPILIGKYYLDEESQTLKMVKASDTHLIGQRIKMRSIRGCQHPDPYGKCSVCYGGMAENIPPRTNLGQYNSTSMTQKSSQLVMSVKHYDGSSVIDPIKIDAVYKDFLLPSRDNNSYLLNGEFLNDKSTKIIIRQSEALGLPDIRDVKDVTELNITRISEVKEIGIQYKYWKGNVEYLDTVVVPVYMNKRLSSMSHELLDYIKDKGWTTDDKENYVIDMDDWTWSHPLTILPFRHFNMSDHSNELALIIESRVQNKKTRLNASAESELMKLSDVTNSKLHVNIAVLEVILDASMVVSEEKSDYRIPKPWTEQQLGVLAVTIPCRSLSGAMAYQDHKTFLTNPSSFFNRNRPSHPMDVFVMPREVVEHFRNLPALK